MAGPKWRTIAEDLQQQIDRGDYPPGSQIPTEPDLMEHYDASRNTVREAVGWLTNRGLLEKRGRQGTFVVEQLDMFVITLSSDPTKMPGGGEGAAFLEEVKANHRTAQVTTPRVEIALPDEVMARELGIDPKSLVVSRHQERRIDNKPWSLQTSFYPMSLVERGARELLQVDDVEPGIVAYLKGALGIEQKGYRDTISARPPNSVEAAYFGIPENGTVVVMETRRTAYDADRKPFRYTLTAYPADRNAFAIEVGDVPSNL